MKYLKIFISFFLLTIYTFGFAHSFLPHCQDVLHKETTNSHHHHEHHEHINESDNNIEHEHILHQGHYDEDLYDLIICFINDMEHPVEDCHFDNYVSAKTNKLFKEKVKLLAILISIVQPNYLIEKSQEHTFIANDFYSSPPIGDSPLRGPPSFSC